MDAYINSLGHPASTSMEQEEKVLQIENMESGSKWMSLLVASQGVFISPMVASVEPCGVNVAILLPTVAA